MLMLTSGENYTLSQIFSENYQIVIPDMQRDYCWAYTMSEINQKSLVENFVTDLISYIGSEEELQMGLLYAYESPKRHIQLCDGQQRLTTLYLILGILFKILPEGDLKNEVKSLLVMSKHKNAGFFEPRFQYAIRESTLSFLTDVLNGFFLNEKLSIEDLKIQDWYFKEYDEDPSIQNIIEALRVISLKVVFLKSLEQFTNLLLHKIKFLYFDMGNRTYGEEQFVVLNTTGKPLTTTENIKPKLLGFLDDTIQLEHYNQKTELRFYSDMWEEWEQFFWENKHKKHKTADTGLKEFFRWVYIIEKSDISINLSSKPEEYSDAQKALSAFHFDILSINGSIPALMNTIQSYFKVLERLTLDTDIKSKFIFKENALSQVALFELLPLVLFLKHATCDISDINFTRFKQFLKIRINDDNVSKTTIISVIRAIQIVDAMKETCNFDLVNYQNYQNVPYTIIINKLERFKLNVLKNSKNRKEIEALFWFSENFKSSKGNILFLLMVQQQKKSVDEFIQTNFDLISFNKLIELVKYTFENPNDLMRRALLCFGHYYIHDGHTTSLNSNRFTLGINPDFYGEIANNLSDARYEILYRFLLKAYDDISNVSKENVSGWLTSQINTFENKNDNIWEKTRLKLIKNKEHIKGMESKLFCVRYDESKSFALRKKIVMNNNAYREL